MKAKQLKFLGMALLAGVAGIPATAAYANASSAAEYFRARAGTVNVPQVLSERDQQYYRDIFTAIAREDWAKVDGLLGDREPGLLHQVAIAEYYTHANSPRVTAEQIAAWFAMGTDLPQAEQLGRLGQKRGLEFLPDLPQAQPFARQPYASKRLRPRSVQDGTMPADISAGILEHIKNDDPDSARLLLDGIDALLSPEARAEWRQRVAWSYYIENRDTAALGMAQTVADGSGPWVAEGEWVVGLAAWRLGDFATAAQGFARTAQLANNVELRTAAHFWAARALTRSRQPAEATKHLQAAAREDETLYGMLSLEQLGQTIPDAHEGADFAPSDWTKLRDRNNVRVAVGLLEIGRGDLADEVLRHQAKIGSPSEYAALSRLARELGLPQTQLWMAHNAPRGTQPLAALRYPTARWMPTSGWQVDPALAFAHALQESNFRTNAVSPADARGLMQITPITVRQHAPRLEMNASYVNLNDPEVNLAFGQRNLEMLRDSGATQGLLPKIMAAYNAGLSPVTRWNSEVRDLGDPLLYMESIPYWETREYVNIVMRNYWMYERQSGAPSASREALAQGMWPAFPESRGPSAVRLTGRN
ncbi:transglycosylase SLT domain-containing protein [Altererythrobacter sp. BO-6]|uniref:lytic transglycosylase domain-containing protein n=1 Tax=Altererythrobacter sp. BO-6 TaxID=2604537 RepID=UPI0013E127AE|nr:transglycosylase SLT domain-containing protein [Altererythrobacter sp. BO-6]QIG52821.1 transglycosylase SLT domain-containing protein [Altererythrobacter sp. BO-6]